MSRLGIIPAAGKGSRWGGYFKELLPIGENRFLIDHSIEILKHLGCSKICVVSSTEKIATHADFFKKEKYANDNIFFVIQRERELEGAVQAALPFCLTTNIFCMPDTICDYTEDNEPTLDHEFGLGVFTTDKPERFGVVRNGRIQDKDKGLTGTIQKAWGMLYWDKVVAEFMIHRDDTSTSFANTLNNVLRNFVTEEFYLDYYKDFASWKDYKEFINEDTGANKAL